MLLSFRVANHGSLREPQELNFAPVYEGDRPAVPVAAIFGANASGKSTVVDAFDFFTSAVKESQARWLPNALVPRRPFLLDRGSRAEPSSYAADFLAKGVRYVYGFSVTDAEVVEEWLYAYPKARKRVLFERAGMSMTYGASLTGERMAVERTMRPNSLYLSAGAQSAHPQLGDVWQALDGMVMGDANRQVATQIGTATVALYKELEDEGLPLRADVLAAADLGVHDVRTGATAREDSVSIRRVPAEQHGEPPEGFEATRAESLEFVHRVGGEDFVLPVEVESAGTKTWLTLVTTALACLFIGRPLWVDEIDVSLHPLLTAKLLTLFQNPELNPLGAQLIFTTHDASLLGTMLGDQVLRRDQVWFVERSAATGASELYPLSDFKPRKGENFERRYLAGSYGAVPLLPETAFEDMLKKHWGTHGEGVSA
ncbi:ATP/GTP-binding protein [Streptomyces sp. NPDC059092]|uniref:AAA family ATPase n=1 Tax=Streptomyces sp. NPDC059092 TaxID=3346725 RepID=UPI00369F3780